MFIDLKRVDKKITVIVRKDYDVLVKTKFTFLLFKCFKLKTAIINLLLKGQYNDEAEMMNEIPYEMFDHISYKGFTIYKDENEWKKYTFIPRVLKNTMTGMFDVFAKRDEDKVWFKCFFNNMLIMEGVAEEYNNYLYIFATSKNNWLSNREKFRINFETIEDKWTKIYSKESCIEFLYEFFSVPDYAETLSNYIIKIRGKYMFLEKIVNEYDFSTKKVNEKDDFIQFEVGRYMKICFPKEIVKHHKSTVAVEKYNQYCKNEVNSYVHKINDRVFVDSMLLIEENSFDSYKIILSKENIYFEFNKVELEDINAKVNILNEDSKFKLMINGKSVYNIHIDENIFKNDEYMFVLDKHILKYKKFNNHIKFQVFSEDKKLVINFPNHYMF